MISTIKSTAPTTITTMIICVPEQVPTTMLTSQGLQRHFGVHGSTSPRFWTTQVHLWQRKQLIDLRQGKPSFCAGGPIRLLNLYQTSHAAAFGAGLRHQRWHSVVKGTKDAAPWHVFAAKHAADPQKYPLPAMQQAFAAQPRVQAMRMHNTVSTRHSDRFDVTELDVLQAGSVTYQNHHFLHATCDDAMLTVDGQHLAPDSDAFADRISYLEVARDHLDRLEPGDRLLAVTL